MASFSDALRGYAYPVHRRDGFRCRYCGQRLPYVKATRTAYREFWEEQVRPQFGATP